MQLYIIRKISSGENLDQLRDRGLRGESMSFTVQK